jgi:hypothetical protein
LDFDLFDVPVCGRVCVVERGDFAAGLANAHHVNVNQLFDGIFSQPDNPNKNVICGG